MPKGKKNLDRGKIKFLTLKQQEFPEVMRQLAKLERYKKRLRELKRKMGLGRGSGPPSKTHQRGS